LTDLPGDASSLAIATKDGATTLGGVSGFTWMDPPPSEEQTLDDSFPWDVPPDSMKLEDDDNSFVAVSIMASKAARFVSAGDNIVL
jgi:hypothetical protein